MAHHGNTPAADDHGDPADGEAEQDDHDAGPGSGGVAVVSHVVGSPLVRSGLVWSHCGRLGPIVARRHLRRTQSTNSGYEVGLRGRVVSLIESPPHVLVSFWLVRTITRSVVPRSHRRPARRLPHRDNESEGCDDRAHPSEVVPAVQRGRDDTIGCPFVDNRVGGVAACTRVRANDGGQCANGSEPADRRHDPTDPTAQDPVSYTHLTLPTIYSV